MLGLLFDPTRASGNRQSIGLRSLELVQSIRSASRKGLLRVLVRPGKLFHHLWASLFSVLSLALLCSALCGYPFR